MYEASLPGTYMTCWNKSNTVRKILRSIENLFWVELDTYNNRDREEEEDFYGGSI
jgi:hypothetical protein